MNNQDDYLWDRTGEPDPEVQQLEEILGTLRYQPRPLVIPAGVQVGRERSFFRGSAPRLAIAAAIAVLLLGVGLFLGIQSLQRGSQPSVAKSDNAVKPNQTPPTPEETRHPSIAKEIPQPVQKTVVGPDRHRVNQALARNTNRIRNAAIRDQQLAEERKKAEAAKDQLMLALRVASSKFNYAQRKAQELNQKDQVHNQHKTG
jgi:hypothetical protein